MSPIQYIISTFQTILTAAIMPQKGWSFMTIYETMRNAINNYNVSGLSADENEEFREILRGILLSSETISAIENLAEIPPDFIGEAIMMIADELEEEHVNIFGDIPQIAVLKTAITAVLAAALSVTVK